MLLDAISSYEKALTFVNEQSYPEFWGMVMHNRGMAYLYLPDKGRQHIDNAIQSFDSALRVRSQGDHPTQWATTMLSRGMALLALGGPEDKIAAVECFEGALRVFTKENYPMQWNMAIRLRDRALGGKPRESFPRIISFAIQGAGGSERPPEGYPTS
jgi:hypothetical protein